MVGRYMLLPRGTCTRAGSSATIESITTYSRFEARVTSRDLPYSSSSPVPIICIYVEGDQLPGEKTDGRLAAAGCLLHWEGSSP